MFHITLFGYAMKTIYLESESDEADEKEISRIIELYK
jgi:hypothetical protein